MSPEENQELYDMLSQELRETNDEGTIRFVLGAFPSTIWRCLNEIARPRIENKRIASLKEGTWERRRERCTAGALGTWATRIITELTLKDELWQAVLSKLGSSDAASQDYVFKYFMGHVEECFDSPTPWLRHLVKKGLRAGDRRFKDLAEGWQAESPVDERPPDHPWRKPFADELRDYVEAPETPPDADGPDDNIPF